MPFGINRARRRRREETVTQATDASVKAAVSASVIQSIEACTNLIERLNAARTRADEREGEAQLRRMEEFRRDHLARLSREEREVFNNSIEDNPQLRALYESLSGRDRTTIEAMLEVGDPTEEAGGDEEIDSGSDQDDDQSRDQEDVSNTQSHRSTEGKIHHEEEAAFLERMRQLKSRSFDGLSTQEKFDFYRALSPSEKKLFYELLSDRDKAIINDASDRADEIEADGERTSAREPVRRDHRATAEQLERLQRDKERIFNRLDAERKFDFYLSLSPSEKKLFYELLSARDKAIINDASDRADEIEADGERTSAREPVRRDHRATAEQLERLQRGKERIFDRLDAEGKFDYYQSLSPSEKKIFYELLNEQERRMLDAMLERERAQDRGDIRRDALGDRNDPGDNEIDAGPPRGDEREDLTLGRAEQPEREAVADVAARGQANVGGVINNHLARRAVSLLEIRAKMSALPKGDRRQLLQLKEEFIATWKQTTAEPTASPLLQWEKRLMTLSKEMTDARAIKGGRNEYLRLSAELKSHCKNKPA